MNKLGITGTRFGWTDAQRGVFRTFLRVNPSITEFHHGLCDGVDTQAHDTVRELRGEVKIVGHPSVDKRLQVERECEELREDKTHFARNRDIVNETDAMLVIPATMEWMARGGTWYTHDYAIKKGKPLLIIWSDGSTDMKNDATSSDRSCTGTPASTSASPRSE